MRSCTWWCSTRTSSHRPSSSASAPCTLASWLSVSSRSSPWTSSRSSRYATIHNRIESDQTFDSGTRYHMARDSMDTHVLSIGRCRPSTSRSPSARECLRFSPITVTRASDNWASRRPSCNSEDRSLVSLRPSRSSLTLSVSFQLQRVNECECLAAWLCDGR